MNLHTKTIDLFCGAGGLVNKCVEDSIKSYNNNLAFKIVNSTETTIYHLTNNTINNLLNKIYTIKKVQNLFSNYILNKSLQNLSTEGNFRAKSEIIRIIKTKKFFNKVSLIFQSYINNNEEFDVYYISKNIELEIHSSLTKSREYRYILSIEFNKEKSKIKNLQSVILKVGTSCIKTFIVKTIIGIIRNILITISNNISKLQFKIIYT